MPYEVVWNGAIDRMSDETAGLPDGDAVRPALRRMTRGGTSSIERIYEVLKAHPNGLRVEVAARLSGFSKSKTSGWLTRLLRDGRVTKQEIQLGAGSHGRIYRVKGRG